MTSFDLSRTPERPASRWSRLRIPSGALLWAALVLLLIVVVTAGTELVRGHAANRDIAALEAGRDVAVELSSASLPVLTARLRFLLIRERFDEAWSVLETIARRDAGDHAVAAFYNSANAQLRLVPDLIHHGRFNDAIAHVNLAKEQYMRALRIDPQHWDAKYNLDIAMRLVRDFPGHDSAQEDEEGEPPANLWTDLPGRPRGMP